MHAAAAGSLEADDLGLHAVGYVVDPEAACVIRAGFGLQVRLLPAGTILLAVDDHEIADDASLVAVGTRVLEMVLRNDAGLPRIRHVDDRATQLRAVRDMADVGVPAGNVHLACAWQVEMPES